MRKVLLAFFITSFFLSTNTFHLPLSAYETTCPEEMTPEECLAFLQEQSKLIEEEEGDLKSGIESEAAQQNSLSAKITGIQKEMSIQENTIRKLQVDIEIKNTEVRILQKDIRSTQDHINTLTQEINKLETSVEKRVAISYKYSFITPFELFLESDNFDGLLRKMKYLTSTRQKDKDLLEDMSDKVSVLALEEEVLAEKKADVQIKLNDSEEKRSELFAEKEALSKQKDELDTLLAISEQTEAEYAARIEEIEEQNKEIISTITQLIIEEFNSGTIPANTPVEKGQIIGFEGHSGFSFGGHLHFELRHNGVLVSPYSTGHFVTPNGNGTAHFPEPGGIVTSIPHWDGSNAIDMTQFYNSDKYWTDGVSCYGMTLPAGWYNRNGEGSPIHSIDDGFVTAVQTDACGGKYVLVDHGEGWVSMYLHLQ